MEENKRQGRNKGEGRKEQRNRKIARDRDECDRNEKKILGKVNLCVKTNL